MDDSQQAHDVFRKTRSGAAFSPWDQARGTVTAPPNFSFSALLAAAVAAEDQRVSASERAAARDPNSAAPADARTGAPASPPSRCAPLPSTPSTLHPLHVPPPLAASYPVTAPSPTPPAPVALRLPAAQHYRFAPSSSTSLHSPSTAVCAATSPQPVRPAQGSAARRLNGTPAREPLPAAPPLARPTRPSGASAPHGCAGGGSKRQSHAAILKAKERRKQRRNARRRERQAAEDASSRVVRASLFKRWLYTATPIQVVFKLAAKRVTSTVFIGLRDAKGTRREYALDELVGEGSTFDFDYLAWDGRTPIPIKDANGVVIALLGGRPSDDGWDELSATMASAIEESRSRLDLTYEDAHHRRGDFVAIPDGFVHGNGTTEPVNLYLNDTNRLVMDELYSMTEFMRLSGFSNDLLATWWPKLYDYYASTMDTLCKHHPHLQRLFRRTVFAASTLNLSPRTVSLDHTDHQNLAFGMCAVTALGSFDPKRGGHLILWDLKLVIEFPPGSTVLIPSALLRHSNTTIRDGEMRYSFTQYTAGGLFRWAEHGFRGEKAFLASLTKKQRAEEQERTQSRWAKGMSMYSTIDELKAWYE
ncbi:hypothetical protein HWV62_35067 [Athelia sp. TMB]|nr:hypothetical protein HWV62_35067 [Athelia sp. TMB]